MNFFSFLIPFIGYLFTISIALAAPPGIPRVDLTLADFEIRIEGPEKKLLKGYFEAETLEWERSDGILEPFVYFRLQKKSKRLQNRISYGNRTYFFSQNKKKPRSQLLLKVALFNSSPIRIGENRITFHYKGKDKLHHIDYSCSRHQIVIDGLDSHPLTLSCHKDLYGKAFELKNILFIKFKVPNWTTELVTLKVKQTGKQTIELVNSIDSTKKKKITVSYFLSERRKRLNLALGLGPYEFTMSDSGFNNDVWISPIMLYANFHLVNDKSIRLFDFFAYSETMFFNNVGVYYAYTMGEAFDGQLRLTPLLGVQGINVNNDFSDETYSDLIGPQGFELTWHHSFGIENYLIGLGMFLSPGEGTDYKNVWLRWGKGYFWEVNFLSYRKEKRAIYTKSWGLSVGFLFGSLL